MKTLKKNIYLPIVLIMPILLTGCLLPKKKKLAHDVRPRRVVYHDREDATTLKKNAVRHQRKNISSFTLEDVDGEDVHHDALLTSPRLSTHNKHVAWVSKKEESQKEFEPVHFDFDSAEIRASEEPKLVHDVTLAKAIVHKNPDAVVVVEGHADKQYISKEYNLAKSEERARQGAKALKKAGIPEEKIKVVAFGDQKPAIDVPGRNEQNRRIEFVEVIAQNEAV